MKYAALKSQTFEDGDYALVPIEKEHMEDIRIWRNDQMDVLRQRKKLSEEDQVIYFAKDIAPEFSQSEPRTMLFGFLYKHSLIGYGGLVHIDWSSRRAEVSFLLKTERTQHEEHYTQEFGIFLELIKRIAFGDLHLHKLFTETFDIRPYHIKTLEKSGFFLEGRLRDHVFIDGTFVDSLLHGILSTSL